MPVANGSRAKTKTHSSGPVFRTFAFSGVVQKPLKTSDPRFGPEYGPEGITKCAEASLWEFMPLVDHQRKAKSQLTPVITFLGAVMEFSNLLNSMQIDIFPL